MVRVLTLALAMVAVGCASSAATSDEAIESTDALASKTVVVANSSATALANVEADRIVLPLAVADKYRTLQAGSIFAGARGGADSTNPDGFLRRVVSVAVDGDALIVTTERAALTDAIVQGAVRASSKGLNAIDGDALSGQTRLPEVKIDFSDQPLFEGVDDIGGVHFAEAVRFDQATFTSKPSVDVNVRIDDAKVSKLVSTVSGNLDTSVRATATVTADGDATPEILAELAKRTHDVKRVVYQSPKIALPNFAVGGVPVSPSVVLTVTLHCQLAFGGALVAHAGVDAKSAVRLGGVYQDGAWQTPIKSEFSITPSFSMEQGGAISARCAIESDAALSAYGDSGITMSVAPYVDFGVKRGAAGTFDYRVDAGADGYMSGQANVFGLAPEDLERKLVEWKAPALLEGTLR